jgi:pullulanase
MRSGFQHGVLGLPAQPTDASKRRVHAAGWAEKPSAKRIRTTPWLMFAWMVVASSAPPAAQAQPASVQDCLVEEVSRVLQPAPASGETAAQGIWLTDRLLRWPGQPAAARYALYVAPRGGMLAQSGRAVSWAADRVALEAHDGPLPSGIDARFPHVAPGATLALPGEARERLAALLQGQLLLVREDAQGRVLAATGTQNPGALDALYAAGVDAPRLGVTPGPKSTGFGLWAPTAQQAALCLHRGAAAEVVAMARDDDTGVWRAALAGDASGGYYTYLVDVFVPGTGLVRNRVTDPYSVSLDADSRRSWIGSLDAPAATPKHWALDKRPAAAAHPVDMVIYELHVRDFSIGDASVPEQHRGKYRAFAADDSAGMRHLRALAAAGLTDVHLLPVFDLASVPETGCVTPAPAGAPDGETQQAAVLALRERDCFNWGYDPWHYTAPEGSYASDAADGATRIREFREMVLGLHRAGLRVGMDVVYNHTSASGQQARSVLDRIVPGYYHRLDARGAVERSTCCENTATEHAMMARLMRDSVATWARDYHIDSFRFDLMGHQPRAVMETVQAAADAAAGRPVPLLGEGWNFGEVANGARFVQAAQGALNGSGIATFSDRLRDAARGGGCCDSGADLVRRQGWLTGLHYAPNAEAGGSAGREDLLRAADLVRVGLAGSLRDYVLPTYTGATQPLHRIDYAGQPAGYASQPGEVVNYVENHDNPTLFDIAALKLPAGTTRDDRARVQLLGAALVASSQGIAYYHAGIDTLRSKSLDRNSFDSGDWFNRLDWSYQDNYYATGLPPQPDNGVNWPWLRPKLADASIKPSPAEISWMRDAFRDLLRIRAGSSLFRLRSADEVRARLRLHNTGPAQEPTLLVAQLDGTGLEGAGFREVLYLLNADLREHALVLEAERARDWVLHPVQRSGTDARARDARYEAASGRFSVPARTAVVFVRE